MESSGQPQRKAARKEPPPTENPDGSRCNYYVARKHRFCRTERRPGSVYCPTHAAGGDGSASAEERVPCPINPNHTVYASRLARHVRVCPDLRFVATDLPYFTADAHANRGAALLQKKEAGAEGERFTHRDLPRAALDALVAKIDKCFRTSVAPRIIDLADVAGGASASLPAGTESESDSEEEAVVEKGADGTRQVSQKHGPQHRALLQCLTHTLSQARPTGTRVGGFVELGAGKGGLSVALQRLLVEYVAARDGGAAGAMEEAHPFLQQVADHPKIAVVDMDGFRRMGDGQVSRTGIPLHRLRINIKDLDLRAALEHTFPGAESGPCEWVALGKHLCGACTDFALSCALRLNEAVGGDGDGDGDADTPPARHATRALVIATCCHHRCELRHLNPPAEGTAAPGANASASGGDGVTLPNAAVHFSAEEFAAMASMTSWAVCGGFVDAERRATGYQCKRIIDALRVAYLEQMGFRAVQCRYTTTDVTGENVCILAWRS